MQKSRILGAAWALLAGLSLAGCSTWSDNPSIRGNPQTASWNLSNAKAGVTQNATAFVPALASEYVQLATTLDQRGDVADADYFARKAIAAERGVAVPPEALTAWAIPMDNATGFRTELTAARQRLVTALDGGARNRVPALAARAQASFDCWIERVEKDWAGASKSECRTAFLAAMDQIEGKTATAAMGVGTPINVFFEFGKTSLTREGREIVGQLAAQMKANSKATVTILGKADLTGSDAANLALSRRRAEAVAAELRRGGVAANRITVQSVGMRQPPVATAKGVREPRNRVVEITLH